jgi:hypothetical protein
MYASHGAGGAARVEVAMQMDSGARWVRIAPGASEDEAERRAGWAWPLADEESPDNDGLGRARAGDQAGEGPDGQE